MEMSDSSEDPSGWQCHKSVSQCNRHMLESGLESDVTFLVSNHSNTVGSGDSHVEQRTFRAHKYALISRSPVFYSMLCGDMAETGPTITIPDVEPDAFQQMLNYIYTDEVDLTPEQVLFVLYASKKYLLPGLVSRCTEFLKENLDASNACTILEPSFMLEEGELMEKCLKIIKLQTNLALESRSFLETTQRTLSRILDSEMFTVSEVDVFGACLKWARQKCEERDKEPTGVNMREALGDCIHKFRFPDMEMRDFARVVAYSEVLSKDEEVEIYRYIADPSLFTTAGGFSRKSRFLPGPFEYITNEPVNLVNIGETSFTIEIECDVDIKIDALIIGKWIETYCSIPGFGTYSVVTYLDQVLCDSIKQILAGGVSSIYDSEKQLWKFHENKAMVIKAGRPRSFRMMYVNSHGRYGSQAKGQVYMVQGQELCLSSGPMQIKLRSNMGFMPLLGFKYEFVSQEWIDNYEERHGISIVK